MVVLDSLPSISRAGLQSQFCGRHHLCGTDAVLYGDCQAYFVGDGYKGFRPGTNTKRAAASGATKQVIKTAYQETKEEVKLSPTFYSQLKATYRGKSLSSNIKKILHTKVGDDYGTWQGASSALESITREIDAGKPKAKSRSSQSAILASSMP